VSFHWVYVARREKTNTVELIRFSSGHAFELLEQVAAGPTQEQADWIPPGIANPIGATYWHVISSVDESVNRWGMGQAPLSRTAGWQERVVTTLAPEDEKDAGAEMRAIRVDLPALQDYARAVAQGVQSLLTALTPEALEKTMDTPCRRVQSGADARDPCRLAYHCPLRRDRRPQGLPRN
jgi:hypothetical protein